jgi:hypothetical protein
MKRKLFVESIEAIKKQIELDIKISKLLSKAFTDAFEANLMPKNHFLQNQLIKVLQEEMNDLELCEFGQSWIEYFCFDLDFGKKYKKGCVKDNGVDIDFSTASHLHEFLNNR